MLWRVLGIANRFATPCPILDSTERFFRGSIRPEYQCFALAKARRKPRGMGQLTFFERKKLVAIFGTIR